MTQSDSKDRPRASRLRWYQFRLRTLLLGVLVASLLCAWYVTARQRAKRQERAVRAIEAAGARVWYDYSSGMCTSIDGDESPWPWWLRRLLGNHFFVTAREVNFREKPTGDDVLAHLADLTGLHTLRLWGSARNNGNSSLSEEDLRYIGGLTHLKSLELEHLDVPDAGLRHLEGLVNLESLGLIRLNRDSNPPWQADAALKHLRPLRRLRELSLWGLPVTGAGLEHLQELTLLESLDLRSTDTADEDLVRLQGLARLQHLDLSLTNVTDAGLLHLQGLTSLRSLNLAGYNVTGAGMSHLVALRELRSLELEVAHLEGEGVAHLKKLPNLRVLKVAGLTHDGLSNLVELRQLEELEFYDSYPYMVIDSYDLSKLSALKGLRTLRLGSTKITDAGLVDLYGLTSLEELQLPSAGVTKAGIAKLRKALPGVKCETGP